MTRKTIKKKRIFLKLILMGTLTGPSPDGLTSPCLLPAFFYLFGISAFEDLIRIGGFESIAAQFSFGKFDVRPGYSMFLTVSKNSFRERSHGRTLAEQSIGAGLNGTTGIIHFKTFP